MVIERHRHLQGMPIRVCVCVEQIHFVSFHTKLSKKMTSSHFYRVILGRKTFSFPHCAEANDLNYTSNPGITQHFLGCKECSLGMVYGIKDDKNYNN